MPSKVLKRTIPPHYQVLTLMLLPLLYLTWIMRQPPHAICQVCVEWYILLVFFQLILISIGNTTPGRFTLKFVNELKVKESFCLHLFIPEKLLLNVSKIGSILDL